MTVKNPQNTHEKVQLQLHGMSPMLSQPTFTCSKLIIETIRQVVKYAQS